MGHQSAVVRGGPGAVRYGARQDDPRARQRGQGGRGREDVTHALPASGVSIRACVCVFVVW